MAQKKLIKDGNLQILFSVTLISIMGVSSLSPAFPGIAKAFNITPEDVGLLITAFTFPGVILTPILGVMADRYGRKRIMVPSLFLFAIAGTACFFTKDFDYLVILRFIQGIGAASLGSLNVTIIGDLYKGKDRGMAMGFNAAVISVGTAVFPIIGGIMATLNWYIPFVLPALAFIVGFLVLTKLNNPEPRSKQSITEYFKKTFKSISDIHMIGLFILSVFTFIILYGPYLTYLPFIVEDIFLEPPWVIGLIMAAASVASFFTSSMVGKLMEKYSIKNLIIISTVFYFISMGLVPILHNVWLLIIPSMLFGVAQGINLPCIQASLASLAPMEQRAAIMSVNGMVFRLGQTLGPLIIVPVYGIWGIEGAYFLGAFISILMLITAFISLRV